jgi:hypothetical protein
MLNGSDDLPWGKIALVALTVGGLFYVTVNLGKPSRRRVATRARG